MQQRLPDILLNGDMLAVNQEFSVTHRFAGGDRIWTAPVGREIWAKPLPGGRVGAVLFNRNGTTSRCDVPTPPYSGSLQVLCDDNVTGSSGAQALVLAFDVLPTQWLLTGDEQLHPGGGTAVTCEVRDIFSGQTGKAGKDLGRFQGSFTHS
jgi:hypothetical protein